MPFAPARPHNFASSWTEARMLCRVGAALSKTHQFGWFQSNQAPRIIKELRPCLSWSATISLDRHHQTSKDGSTRCGARVCSPNLCKSSNQDCLEKTQETSRWLMVSSSWYHTTSISGDVEDPAEQDDMQSSTYYARPTTWTNGIC